MGKKFFRIGRARIFITSYGKVIEGIKSSIELRKKGYVCVSNMRTIAIANRDDCYQDVMEHSLMNTPDGTPLIWCARLWDIKEAERVCGPLLLEKMLDVNCFKHFFLGDTYKVLTAVKNKAENDYNANVRGIFSPPFAPIEDYDIEGMTNMINESGANVVWTSLKAPKQDYLNARLLPYLRDDIVLIGVGAAFRTFIGEIKVENGVLSKIGLGGFKMIRKDSSFLKEVRWYLKHSFLLTKYMTSIVCKRMRGRKYWE